jgi:hypothetical protein
MSKNTETDRKSNNAEKRETMDDDMAASIAIVVMAVGIGFLFLMSWSVYGRGDKHLYSETTCVKFYFIDKINVCESNNFRGTGLENIFMGGAFQPSSNTVFISPTDVFKDQTINHELCHACQIQINKTPDEIECYYKMWLSREEAMRCSQYI